MARVPGVQCCGARRLCWRSRRRVFVAHPVISSCCASAVGAFGAQPNPAQSEGPAQRTKNEVKNAKLRAVLFFTISMGLAIPLFLVMSVMYPVVMLVDRYRRKAEHFANKIWAILSTILFVEIKVEGRENMPSNDCPAVFVANHESFMDIFSLFILGKDFKFVSKRSIFSIPFVGWSMWLTGHIALDRQDAAGFRRFVKQGCELLDNGASLVIFPEGTRSMDGKLGPFKKGAFTIATRSQVPVVPITILGSGDIMPSGKEGELHRGMVRVVVHPLIPTVGKKTSSIAEECRDVIASRLPHWKLL